MELVLDRVTKQYKNNCGRSFKCEIAGGRVWASGGKWCGKDNANAYDLRYFGD